MPCAARIEAYGLNRRSGGYLVNAYRTTPWRVAALRAHLSVPKVDEEEKSFAEHQRLIALFNRGQGDAIDALLDQHIMRAASIYRAALAASPQE
jgi:DNA-binding GntR family transcriptional regulator